MYAPKTMPGNIVAEWLRSLRLAQYADSFIDNGYDDLEICKQVGDPDLDAIGVLNASHRARLLQSVRTLREEGAASVYFTLEESAALHDECFCEDVSAGEKEAATATATVGRRGNSSPGASSSTESGQEVAKYLDEYEEGKAELVKIPRVQLKVLLKEKLGQDGIRLSCLPYSTQDGDRGYLEGLASRYADLFSTHYVDVLGHLEDLRRIEWSETSPKERKPSTPDTPPSPIGRSTPSSGHSGPLTSSISQPIYVPGKYSPSSCLSDKEEDEIYGFGYGVFASQIARQQQQRLLGQQQNQQQTASHQPLLVHQHHNYQTCLSPRSAYFYEFPPNDQNYTNTSKKRTTFSRFLRGLKTSHRKEKHGASSPRHGRAAAAARGVPQRVDTPDSVLQSGLGLTDLGQHAVLRSMVDPRDYDRLRNLQLNGGTPNTFEETIYKLKLQEALRKREKFSKEHEEILRDIKQGLLQLGKEGIRGPLSGDDTYMYDEDARMLAPVQSHYADPLNRPAHWYDEPPYESDPEDFLMGCNDGPTATIQNGRVCFTLNARQDARAEGVISLRSAGDISLPQGPRRGLILPSQAGRPAAIIPLRSPRDAESADYAGSDVQSVGSRLSALSMDAGRSEHYSTTQYYAQLEGKIRHFRKIGGYARSEDGLSPGQSSDYEEQDDYSNCSQQIATVHVSSDGRSAGASGLAGKVRGLREDVQRKISRLKLDEQQRSMEQPFQCSASSVESLPSGSGSSTQALVRAGSNHSSISNGDEPDASPTEQIVGRARALVDHVPSPYDADALKFKAGDIIDVVSMNPSGQWRGVCRGRKGTFKFINVELLSERSVKSKRDGKWHRNIKGKPMSVEDLLMKIGLHDYISVFILNGYEDLELFKELEPSDLDYLGIVNTDHRAKLLTAVQMLHELDSGSEGDVAGSSSECDEHRRLDAGPGGGGGSPFGRRQFPRDSGCYEAGAKPARQRQRQRESYASDGDKNNLDSVVEQCNNEIMARVKQAQKNLINLKEELAYQPNIPNSASVELQLLQQKKPKDSYVGVHGQTSLIDPCRKSAGRPLSGGCARKNLDDAADEKYIQSGTTSNDLGLEAGSANVLGRSCLSEKSSDSGVSSSSISSANTKETRPVLVNSAQQHFIDNAAAHGSFKKM
ncbi:unnamed protein product [Phyllotreta striolata]|uniref:Sterile alpha motif domain-containing protein 5 n=1 Tax=Phyllotreta striolata TaxID=444603 RepID=A0A9P0GXH9_PHYSR|nr:unnamed protein product [Phyllotreta striolata]